MKSIALALAGGLIAGLVCSLSPALMGQGSAGARVAAGTARITGVVRADDSGRPLADASVYLSTSETGNWNRSVVTVADGRFDFQQLQAGRYWIMVQRPGFPRMIYGQRRPGRAGRPVDVADGQIINDLIVRLVRGSVLTGTVFGADGEPATHVSVGACRYAYVDGVRQLQYVQTSELSSPSTDDRGVYRIAGLDPGEYFVSIRVPRTAEAGAPSTIANPTRAGSGVFGGDMVFYPGTSMFASAESVKLAVGEERAGIDVHLSPEAVTTVSGIVTGADMKKASAILQLAIDGNPWVSNQRADAKADGTFLFPTVPTGAYVLFAHTLSGTGAMEPMHVMVGAQPVANLQLQPTHTMSGRILWQGPTRPPAVSGRVIARDTRVGLESQSATHAIASDSTFRVEGLFAGRYYIGVQALPGGWSLKSVMIAGRDVTDVPFDYDGGGDVDDVVIELTNQTTELSGALTDADARPAIDYTIVAFAADARYLSPFSRRIQASQSSQDGRFVIRDLPPGDYLFAAVDDVEPGAWVEPAFLDKLRATAVRIHLGEGEQKTQDLRLVR